MDQQSQLSMLGSGSAGQAGQQIAGRHYMLYVQEAQALGQQPMPFPQWMQMQQQGGQPLEPQPGMSQQGFSNGTRPSNQEQLLQLLKARAMGGQ